MLARTRSQAGHARQKVRTPQSEKSSNRGPQMIFLMNCDKSLPRIRGGLFPSCLGSHHPVPVPGNECGEKVFPEFGEGFFPRAARLLCGLLDPWRSAVASWACAAIKDPTTSSLRPRGRQHVFYRMYWGFGRFAKRSTRGLAQASALLFHLQPTKTLSEFARAQIGRLPGVERPISKYSKFVTLIFTAWPKERQCGVYVTPRPPGSFCERKSGPTTARRSLLGEI